MSGNVECVVSEILFSLQGGRRFSEGTSADREIQRTLMEVKWAAITLRYMLHRMDNVQQMLLSMRMMVLQNIFIWGKTVLWLGQYSISCG